MTTWSTACCCLWLLTTTMMMTTVMGLTTLNVQLDPDRPTQLYRAPSADGSSAWIITAADKQSQHDVPSSPPSRPSYYHQQKRPYRPVHRLPPASVHDNEIRGSSSSGGGGSSQFLPASFVVTSRPFGLAGGSPPQQRPRPHQQQQQRPRPHQQQQQQQRPQELHQRPQQYQQGGDPTYVELGAIEARPEQPEAISLTSPDGVDTVEGLTIPSYDVGCQQGKKCSYIISVTERNLQPHYTAYNKTAVDQYLDAYKDILAGNPNRTSSYLIQKLEPKKRHPTPMEAYQQDQLSAHAAPGSLHAAPGSLHAAPGSLHAATPAPSAPVPVRRRPEQYAERWSTFYNLFGPLWNRFSQRHPSSAPPRRDQPAPPRLQGLQLGASSAPGRRPGTSGYYNSIPSPWSEQPARLSRRRQQRLLHSAGNTLVQPPPPRPQWSKFSVQRERSEAPAPPARTLRPTGQVFHVHLSSGRLTVQPEPGQDLERERRRLDRVGDNKMASIVTDEGERQLPNVMSQR